MFLLNYYLHYIFVVVGVTTYLALTFLLAYFSVIRYASEPIVLHLVHAYMWSFITQCLLLFFHLFFFVGLLLLIAVISTIVCDVINIMKVNLITGIFWNKFQVNHLKIIKLIQSNSEKNDATASLLILKRLTSKKISLGYGVNPT